MQWTNPLKKVARIVGPMGEITPFVFNGKLYKLENWPKYFELPGRPPDTRFMEDALRIWDVEEDKLVTKFMTGYSFGFAFLWEGRVYVYAARHNPDAPWRYYTEIDVTWSDDLINWAQPQLAIKAQEGEHLFNTAVCWDGERFVLLFETDDPAYPAFTFKYCTSDDLLNWKLVPGALYGKEKYVGGPALYFEGGYYYTLYLEDLHGTWETRICRSKDLLHWENAPDERPFLTYERGYVFHSELQKVDVPELNASDAELCYHKGKTIVYFAGGDQWHWSDHQRAEFEGTPCELLESYFAEPEGIIKRSEIQRRYQENMLGVFVHFGTPAYLGDNPAKYVDSFQTDLPGEPFKGWELMTATPPAALFDPADLDADQWARTAKAMGAKHIVFTSKHHSGFCMWPTKTTDYSVKNSPWRGGKGDVLMEFVEAARRHGLSPGFYISVGDANMRCMSTPEVAVRRLHGDRERYFELFMEQLSEILTGYGKIEVLWMDGALDPFGLNVLDANGEMTGTKYHDQIAALIRRLQPEALINGPVDSDLRCIGNEVGEAEYPQLNVMPDVNRWQVPESVVFTRNTWFWTPNTEQTVFSVEKLTDIYHSTIGRGTNILLNITPNDRGLISDTEVKAMEGLGRQINRLYSTPAASMPPNTPWSEDHCIELELGDEQPICAVLLEEDLDHGQRVEEFEIDYLQDGRWQRVKIEGGKSIGRMRIEHFPPITTSKLRLKIQKSLPLPKIRRFEAF